MKPILELTAAHVGKEIRVTDQHLAIEGHLSEFRTWAEFEKVRNGFGSVVRHTTTLFIEVEFDGINGPIRLTNKAKFGWVAE